MVYVCLLCRTTRVFMERVVSSPRRGVFIGVGELGVGVGSSRRRRQKRRARAHTLSENTLSCHIVCKSSFSLRQAPTEHIRDPTNEPRGDRQRRARVSPPKSSKRERERARQLLPSSAFRKTEPPFISLSVCPFPQRHSPLADMGGAEVAEPLAVVAAPEPAERQFIDLAELQQELDGTKALLTAWASDTTKAAEDCRRRHMHELRGLKGGCRSKLSAARQSERRKRPGLGEARRVSPHAAALTRQPAARTDSTRPPCTPSTPKKNTTTTTKNRRDDQARRALPPDRARRRADAPA